MFQEKFIFLCRPTILLFWIILFAAIALPVIPIFLNYFSSWSWSIFIDQLERTQNELDALSFRAWHASLMIYAIGGIFLLWFLTIFFYRRGNRKLILSSSTKGGKIVGLNQGAPQVYEQILSFFSPLLPKNLGRIHFVLNNSHENAESFVRSIPGVSWVIISICDLITSFERVKFIVLHEIGHIINGDSRIVGWVQAILKASIISYLFCSFSISIAAVFLKAANYAHSFLFEDFMYLIMVVSLLPATAMLLKNNEIAADLVAASNSGDRESFIKTLYTYGDTKGHDKNSWLTNVLKFLRGKLHHPQFKERISYIQNPSAYYKTLNFIPIFLGFLTMIFGHWGLAIDPGLAEKIDPATGTFPEEFKNHIPLMFTYPLRVIILFFAVGIVTQDILRGYSFSSSTLKSTFQSSKLFFKGGLWLLLFSGIKGIFTGTPLFWNLLGLISQILWILFFAFIFFITLLASLRIARKLLEVSLFRESKPDFIRWIGFLPLIFYLVLSASGINFYSRENPFDALNSLLIFFIFAPITCIIIGEILTWPLRKCKNCTRRGVSIVSELSCSRCGVRVNVLSNDSLQYDLLAYKRFVNDQSDTFFSNAATILGGVLGSAFLIIIPIIIAVTNFPIDKLKEHYSAFMSLAVMCSLLGGVAGFSRVILSISRYRMRAIKIGATVIVLLAIFFLPVVVYFLPAISVVVALFFADYLDKKKITMIKLRYRIILCILFSGILALTLGSAIISLSYWLGYDIGVYRGPSFITSNIHPIQREIQRNLGDSLLSGFFIGFGIASFETVFSRRNKDNITQFSGEPDIIL